ncbi:MAG TPA: GspE/PulE family protein [Aestuariivirgaceae bacterium]|jgi:general secretion pathway protein E
MPSPVEPAQAAPVPRQAQKPLSPSDLVDSFIREALVCRASDVHLEPNESGLLVRYRVHGDLQNVMAISPDDRAPVISRIKIMAKLNIAEHRLPQDGRIRLRQNGHAVDVRVSTMPSLHGEKVVLRLLDLDGVAIPLDNIGLREDHLRKLRHLITRPQGIIFVTGPTGSGKTSTIYAALNEIKTEKNNIITIEDPIEYEIRGVTQIAVHEKIGLTFATCLRSVLRQDPDVILVGEVRDQETARIAMQASLTGHLVFATLHTNDALGAITRLLEMGIAPYLIASSLSGILAQRLVQVLCPDCKVPARHDAKMVARLGRAAARMFQRGPGCERCRGLGAVARVGVFELVTMTPELRALIVNQASEAELRHLLSTTDDLHSMFQDGLAKVIDGRVAYDELVQTTEPDRNWLGGQESQAAAQPTLTLPSLTIVPSN